LRLKIENIVGEVDDGKSNKKGWDSIRGIAVHRVGLDDNTGVVLGYDGVSICKQFTDNPKVAKYTGAQLPYTFIIGGDRGPEEFDGKIWQCLEIGDIGFHARRFSAEYIGVALVGDFRKLYPSESQRSALVDLLASLCAGWGIDPYRQIKGHGEIQGAHDGSKANGMYNACPGDMCNMFEIRDDVSTIMKDGARQALLDAGLGFGD